MSCSHRRTTMRQDGLPDSRILAASY
jgi:hypothetical protein